MLQRNITGLARSLPDRAALADILGIREIRPALSRFVRSCESIAQRTVRALIELAAGGRHRAAGLARALRGTSGRAVAALRDIVVASDAALTMPTVAVLRRRSRPINLALQGGGAYGAFTWGVLDRLLDAPLRIAAISGTSAGAMNAAVLASGMQDGGPQEARRRLEAFWRDISALGRGFGPMSSGSTAAGDSMLLSGLAALSRVASPYQLNPLGINPLRAVIERHVDFAALRRPGAIRLYVAATDVETGSARVFAGDEVSADAVLASACLPQLHHAVRVGTRFYWDGGFTANPAILPLLDAGAAEDTLVVQLLPLALPGVPTDPRAIRARSASLAFVQSYRRELDEIVRRQDLARAGFALGSGARRRAARHRFHRIEAPATMLARGDAGAIDVAWKPLSGLRDEGHRTADAWCRRNLRALGRRSTVDFAADLEDAAPAAAAA